MTEQNQQQNAAPRLVLLSSVLGVTGAIHAGIGLITGGNLLAIAIGGLSAVVGLPISKYYRQEYEVTPSQAVVAVGQVFDDWDLALDGVDMFPNMAPAIARRLRPMRSLVLEDDAPAQWMTNDFWSWHTCYIGNSGSHKSVNFKHHADQFARIYGLDSIWGICDSHYDPSEENEIDTWFYGIPREEIPFYKEPEKEFAALRSFYQEFKRRKENNLKAEPMAALFVDEFERAFPEGQIEQAVKMLADIVDEGRKYQIRLFISNQSPKNKRSGLDSGIIQTMTMVLMGETIGDTTVAWPQDLNGAKGKALTGDVQAMMASRPGAEYVTAVIRPGSNCRLSFRGPHVRQLPDRSQEQIKWEFEEGSAMDRLAADAEQAIATGNISSFTALCRALGLHGHMGLDKSDSDRKYKDDRVQFLFETFGGKI